jgi:hypothetical protein
MISSDPTGKNIADPREKDIEMERNYWVLVPLAKRSGKNLRSSWCKLRTNF